MADTCRFCNLDASRVWLENFAGIVLDDAFPISQGHALAVPRRHVASFYDLSPDEQAAMWQLAGEARLKLLEQYHPDGFNIGLNDGPAAGQTVMHAHIHVIPRYSGDQEDPRGGIRWIIPEKAPYWREGDQ